MIDKNGYKIENLGDVNSVRHVETINFKLSDIEKKGFDHFMLKEIHEQSESARNVLRGRISKDFCDVLLGGIKDNFDKIERVIFLASGTSFLYDRKVFF